MAETPTRPSSPTEGRGPIRVMQDVEQRFFGNGVMANVICQDEVRLYRVAPVQCAGEDVCRVSPGPTAAGAVATGH